MYLQEKTNRQAAKRCNEDLGDTCCFHSSEAIITRECVAQTNVEHRDENGIQMEPSRSPVQ